MTPVKALVRREFDRRGLEIIADPFVHRIARMCQHLGIDTVLDGGANTGQYASAMRRAGFSGRIISVEPQSGAFATLSQAAANDPDWVVQRCALASERGSIELHISGNSVSSSVLPMLEAHAAAAPSSAYVGKETVEALTVDSLLAQFDADPSRTLLKLDLQGFEEAALAGARRSLEKIPAVQVELSYVPLYDGQWLAPAAEAFLADRGFQLWMHDPATMNDAATGRTLQADGVFVRPRPRS